MPGMNRDPEGGQLTVTQTAFAPVVTPWGRAPSLMVLTTVFVRGSIFERVLLLRFATQTAPAPTASALE